MQFAEIRHDYIWGEAVENGLNHRAGDPLFAAVSIDIIVDFHDNGVRMDQQVL